ncbi:DNA translocase FtsK [Arcobacter sp. FWKO B]|nr:DNA translocase FtsK [Arcobacter sp. FWKO B]
MATKIFSIIIAFIFIYLTIGVFVIDNAVVGKLGFMYANFALEYFGYIAYILLLVLLIPLYKLNTKKFDVINIVLNTVAGLFALIATLISQALIINDGLKGEIGNNIITYLHPYIGQAGLWMFVLIGYIVASTILFEEYLEDLIEKFLFYVKKSKDNKVKTKYIQKVQVPSPKVKEKVVVKEEKGKATITLSPDDNNEVVKPFLDNTIEPMELNVVDESSSEEEIKTDDKICHPLLVEELEENKKLLDEIELGVSEKPKDFMLPPVEIFQSSPKEDGKNNKVNEAAIDRNIENLLDKLAMFKIEGDVVRTYTGPVVTTFEFKPAPNVKVSKILNLQDDLAMALKAQTIRIQAPIPGKDVVGIEVPNESLQTIYLREILESEIFQNSTSPLTMILGKDIVGKPFITDLKKLPHLLIAGTTGSGKSVGINSMILSLLYKNSPDNLKLIMIDPKMLEFSIYNDIPHLLTPVITKPAQAINALANMVAEMERRYTLMSKTKTKNIESYNEKAKKEGFDPIPYIVVIIDELADLMMTSGKEVELSIARLAQMARASGIHLIVATQRPSVDVVTGLIKANLPSRISYKVGQRVDSKIILDAMGAESLLGRGDMLFTPPGSSNIVRIHAPWSTEDEIDQVVQFLKNQREVVYDIEFLKDKNTSLSGGSNGSNGDLLELDELYEDAKDVVYTDRKTSISHIQRRLRIGYNRAANIVEQLEAKGVLSAPNTKGDREIIL